MSSPPWPVRVIVSARMASGLNAFIAILLIRFSVTPDGTNVSKTTARRLGRRSRPGTQSPLAPLVAHFVGRGPRFSGLVTGQRGSHPSDLDAVCLLARPDLTVRVLLG